MKRYTFGQLNAEDIKTLGTERNKQMSLDANIFSTVENVLTRVRDEGEQALRFFTEKFDQVVLSSLFIGEEEIRSIASAIDPDAKAAIDMAYSNIYTYHHRQLSKTEKIQTAPGVNCWRESRAIGCAGIYIPGGSAVLPSTMLMLGIPARLAGVPELIVCSPPQKEGPKINSYLAYVARLLNIKKIYTLGGVQAIAAMGFGIGMPKADKLFGPGNSYVTAAKQLIQQLSLVSIDMPAGPSEVLIIADESADPSFAAADLLAQAEHGPDSQVVLVSTSEAFLDATEIELTKQLALLPRASIAERALQNSFFMQAENLEEAFQFSNLYAPEHLILLLDSYESFIPRISSAGSVFLGHYSPESVGDYASGTNHTLPTSGYARMYSGVSVDSFQKQISFQHLSPEGLQFLGLTVEKLAEIEGLQAHREAVSIRLARLDQEDAYHATQKKGS